MAQGQLSEAENLLIPLLKQRHLCYDNHFMLIASWALLLAKKGDVDGARYWQGILEDIHTAHPLVSQFRTTLDRSLNPSKVRSLLSRLWRKQE